MKQLVFAALLAALLAGCSEFPSKDAAIEDRGTRSEGDQAAQIVDAKPAEVVVPSAAVETQPAAGTAGVAETQARTEDSTRTAGTATRPISEKSVGSAQTRGVTPPAAQTLAIGQPASVQVGSAQDGATLPNPENATPGWGELKNPGSPLSKRRFLFDYDSSAIRDEYRSVLEAHARFLSGHKDAKVILQGNTDERGSREYNLALGQRRAESIFNALNLLGVNTEQMEAVSFGEEKPVSEGHDEAAWQQNRRTELVYQGE